MLHAALSSLLENYGDGRLMTVVREPVARLLSLWIYWRGTSDEILAPWGQEWGDHVRISRDHLAAFLRAPQIACQTDNQCLRMLLWPHPLIPNDGFIPPQHDNDLLEQAIKRLDRFDFVDAVENPCIETNLVNWLGRPAALGRHNVTGSPPSALRASLTTELSPETSALLAARSRLDVQVWARIIRMRMPGVEPSLLSQQTIAATFQRHAALLAS